MNTEAGAFNLSNFLLCLGDGWKRVFDGYLIPDRKAGDAQTSPSTIPDENSSSYRAEKLSTGANVVFTFLWQEGWEGKDFQVAIA